MDINEMKRKLEENKLEITDLWRSKIKRRY